jgi:copper(I)-binding protein
MVSSIGGVDGLGNRYHNEEMKPMTPVPMRFALATLLVAFAASVAHAAGRLVIEQAWIRTPPPGAMMLAGYARLRNAGDAPLVVVGASSAAFGAVSLHETVHADGVEHMRALAPLTIAPGAAVEFAPGGRHLMLMQPKQALGPGDRVPIHVEAQDGGGADAPFVVGDAAPAPH